MKSKLFLITLFFWSLFGVGQELDQQELIFSNGVGDSNFSNLSQSFQAGISGKLTKFDFAMTTNVSPLGPLTISFTVHIRKGQGNAGDIVATTTFTITNNFSTVNFASVVFPTPANIITGDNYTIEFIRTSSLSNLNSFRFAGTNSVPSGPNRLLYINGILTSGNIYFKTWVVHDATHLNFDGIDDSVEIPGDLGDELRTKTEFTVEYMFKGTALRRGFNIQSGNDFYIIAGMQNGTDITFNISSDGGTGGGISCGTRAIIEDNNWHHLAFVWKKNTILATYLDGVLQNSRVAANINLPEFSGTKSNIGSRDNSSQFTAGNFDEVRIWSVALSQSEIVRRKNCQISAGESNLLAYYRANQGAHNSANTAITTLTSINNPTYNGELKNFALNGLASNWVFASPINSNSTIPLNPLISNQSYCGSTTIGGLVYTATPAGFTQKWYAAESGGIALTNTTPITTSGVYYVSNSNAFGCESPRTFVYITITSPNAPTAASPQNYTPTSTVANLTTTSGTNIQWYATLTGGTALAPSTPLSNNTTYFVSQKVNTCESERTAVLVNNVLSTNENNLISKLKIYPNPATNKVTIDFDYLTNPKLEVFDIDGKKLFTRELKNFSNQIDIENLQNGIYMFKVSAFEGTSTLKVIKN